MATTYKLKAEVWLYPGVTAAWHFVYINKKISDEIKSAKRVRRGFGSVPVSVAVGKSVWKTSIFPESKSGTYLLPLKAEMRRKEGIRVGDTISLKLEVRSR